MISKLYAICFLFGLAACGLPQSPCPNIFEYRYDKNGIYGFIQVNPADRGRRVETKVKFTVSEKLKSNDVGTLKPLQDYTKPDWFNGYSAIEYRVNFPPITTVPKITLITVNDKFVCAGPEDPPTPYNYVTTITLEHVIYLKLNNENQIPLLQWPGPNTEILNTLTEVPINLINSRPTLPTDVTYSKQPVSIEASKDFTISRPAVPIDVTNSRPAVSTDLTNSRPVITIDLANSRPAVPTDVVKPKPAVPDIVANSRPTVSKDVSNSRSEIPTDFTNTRPAIPIDVANSRPVVPINVPYSGTNNFGHNQYNVSAWNYSYNSFHFSEYNYSIPNSPSKYRRSLTSKLELPENLKRQNTSWFWIEFH